MLRIVWARTLSDLLAVGRQMRNERDAARRENESLRRENDLMRQARDFYKDESTKWERRASKFIDQVGVRDGMLGSPAMQDPSESRPDPARRVMTALGIDALSPRTTKPTSDEPSNGAFLGVNEGAAADAVAGVMGT